MRLLDRAADSWTDTAALITDEITLSWRELRDAVHSLAAWLQDERGVRPGDIVATHFPNSAFHFQLIHAIWYCAATAAPVNIRLSPDEQEARLAHLAPALQLTASDEAKYAERAYSKAEDYAETAYSRAGDDAETAYEGNCSLLYTSGSSGNPHAVLHSWQQHRASAAASAANLPLGVRDCWQCVIPLYHIGGLAILTRSLFSGCTVRLHDGFDTGEVDAALRDGTVTVSSLVPTMLHRLLAEDDALLGTAMPRLRAILLGGAPASQALWQRVRERVLPVVGTYGLTESCAQVATADPLRWQEEAGTAGRPLPGVKLRILQEDSSAAGPGEAGEIVLSGEMIAAGYFRNDDATRRAFSDEGFRTGDIGMIDASGFLHVLARREDLILSGGENILPAEIEEVLLQHTAVREVAVVGVPHEEWGQQVAAAVVVEGDLREEALTEFCRERLAGYKLPRCWLLLDALPRTASGKLLRGELRRLFDS
ncbi:o-succinylbenzoate--CoA ligase [bacterium]|nr:o-succinylbenzoate--CoA ligase [bacterium]